MPAPPPEDRVVRRDCASARVNVCTASCICRAPACADAERDAVLHVARVGVERALRAGDRPGVGLRPVRHAGRAAVLHRLRVRRERRRRACTRVRDASCLPPFVGRGSVDGGNGNIELAQVYRELSAMMHEVAQRLSRDRPARRGEHHLVAHHERPRLVELRIGHLGQRLARRLHVAIELGEQRRRRSRWSSAHRWRGRCAARGAC